LLNANVRGVVNEVHAIVDAKGRPVHVALTPGERHEMIAGPELLDFARGSALIDDTGESPLSCALPECGRYRHRAAHVGTPPCADAVTEPIVAWRSIDCAGLSVASRCASLRRSRARAQPDVTAQ
jgi:hypothetical protein